MVAHTGFLIFGRRIEPVNDERGIELARELGAPILDPQESQTTSVSTVGSSAGSGKV
jgi:hypothetical protein